MKKIPLLTKIIFHISNIGLILLYLYPGSIIGWVIYGNFQKQAQITSDFSIICSINSSFIAQVSRLYDFLLEATW